MADINTYFTEQDAPVLSKSDLTSSISKSANLVETIREENEVYALFKDRWSFYLDAYEGGEDFVSSGNIFKHSREHQFDYFDRIKRAANHNYTQPLVDFFSNFIFSEAIARFGGSHDLEYQEFLKDVNLRGDTMDVFMKDRCDDAQIFGHIDILVDKPSFVADRVLSKYEEKTLGTDRIYLVPLFPLEVIDWDFDVFGRFKYLKRKEIMPDGTEVYTIWYRNKIDKYTLGQNAGKYNILEVSSIDNPINEVPIVRCFYKRSKRYKHIGSSFIKDIAYLNRKVLNLTSLIDEFLHRQCVVGDTLIDCPRDLEQYPYGIPIQELVGKEFPTYTWDIEKQKYTIRKAYDVRKTGEKQSVYRLTFEYKDEYNQTKTGHLDATENHPILLQNGEYINLNKLNKGDKLVPFYRGIEVQEAVNHSVVSVEYLGTFDVYNMEVEEHHNYVANGIVVHNCFNFLAKEVEPGIPMGDQVEGDVGTSNFMNIPRGAQYPKYITPPVDPAQFLQSEREKNVLEIYRIAAQDTAVEIFTGQSRSGDAQNQSFSKTVPYISTRAENMENAEKEIARIWLKWKDASANWDGRIDYKDDYSVTSLTSFILQLKMLITDVAIPSPTFIKEEMTRLIQEFDGKIPSEKMVVIAKEIEEHVNEDYLMRKQMSKVTSSKFYGANMQQNQQGEMQEALQSKENIAMAGSDNLVDD